MSKVVFSVVIPVYNAAPFLQSALKQLPYGENFEFIFVDDGSTDDSAIILQEYCKNDCRAALLRRQHGGTSAARNAGIEAAIQSSAARNAGTQQCSDYIMFLDCDDYIFANAYETLAALTEGAPDVIVFGARVVNHDRTRTLSAIEPRDVVYKPFAPEALFCEAGSKPYVWNCAYRTAFIKQNRLRFSTETEVGEDLLFQFCTLPRAQMIRFSSDKLYCYNYLKFGSVMSRYDHSAALRAQSGVKVVDLIISDWQQSGCYQKYKESLVSWIYDFLRGDFRILCGNDYKTYSAQLRQVFKKHGIKLKELKLPFKRKLRLYGLQHHRCRILADYIKNP